MDHETNYPSLLSKPQLFLLFLKNRITFCHKCGVGCTVTFFIHVYVNLVKDLSILILLIWNYKTKIAFTYKAIIILLNMYANFARAIWIENWKAIWIQLNPLNSCNFVINIKVATINWILDYKIYMYFIKDEMINIKKFDMDKSGQ